MGDIVASIRQELQKRSDPAIRESGMRFFREEVKMYGLKTADVTRIGEETFKAINDRSKKEIFGLCDELWRSGYMEESFIACGWSYALRKSFAPADFMVFERWISKYVGNWASCDTFCNHTVGAFLEMYPAHVKKLKKWALSKNRWVRRAAAVSLIIPARKGLFLKEVFGIADVLLSDPDDMVQKGYGWMLKSASQSHEREVFEYVMKKKVMMPRTALRYAIEKMPEAMKKKAMQK